MLYVDFKAGNNIYKLRLNTRNIIMLEKNIGCNPLGIFTNANGTERMPTYNECLNVLFASMQQYNHGITFDVACDIFDQYVEDGNVYTDFIPVILEIYKASGIIRENKDQEDNSEKN